MEIGHQKSFAAGDTLFPQSGYGRSDILLIESGWAKVTISGPGGQELVESVLSRDDVIGIRELLTYGPPSKATALTDLHGVWIHDRAFRDFLKGHSHWWEVLARDMAREAAAVHERLLEQAWENADRRLARIVLHMIDMDEALAADGSTTIVPLTQSDLANTLGSRRETVERTLKDWRNRGIVVTEPRTITILRLEDLARIAGTTLEYLRRNQEPDWDAGCSHSSHRQA